ncbi:hypothetical protein [Mycobacterium hubeiense]|uniref:hypothetical protein n=1 Tax=Mycobacterium hubeiense TaxID=1867256 RepID=UPI000C7EBE53|nr:hypothetical protein [Mycobacterium sp. QGD 101]
MSPNAFHTDTDEQDRTELFVGYNRDRSIIVTYSHYGFVGLELTDRAYRLTETALGRAIVEVAKLAHQRAMAHLREVQLSLGTSRRILDRRDLPTAEQVDALQQRIDEDPDI